ncbi:MAG: erythromycin esterase family protein [Gemmatimonadetes bacterium]|nr:erythromycin esterase family protein [Gemmatimonadota bacterium]
MLQRLALFATLVLASARLAAQSDSGTAAWIARTARPIDASGKALRSLDPLIAPARIISVGESEHMVQEFLAFRRMLLEDLVRRHRVTALILESGLAESMAANDYVHGRSDSLNYASALGADFGSTDEIRRALAWLRSWNRGPGKAHPVSVYGADLANGGSSMLPALDRLRVLTAGDPTTMAIIDSLWPIAERVSGPWWRAAAQKYDSLPATDRTRLTMLASRLVSAAGRLASGTSAQRAWAERLARVVQQEEIMVREGAFSRDAPRDQAMAETTRWILGRLPDGERAMVWVHNAHVQRVPIAGTALPPPGSFPGMGFRLGKDLAERYLAIGTAYGGPALRGGAAPRAHSVDAALGGVAEAPFVLSLRGASTGTLHAWLNAEREMRFDNDTYLTLSVARAFDVLVYFDAIHPAVTVP